MRTMEENHLRGAHEAYPRPRCPRCRSQHLPERLGRYDHAIEEYRGEWSPALGRYLRGVTPCSKGKGNWSHARAAYEASYRFFPPSGRSTLRRLFLCRADAERFAERHGLVLPQDDLEPAEVAS